MKFFKTLFTRNVEGSTEQLMQLCSGYLATYILVGFFAKLFTPKLMSGVEYLVYSTMGGSLICIVVVIILKWYKLKSAGYKTVMGKQIPMEFFYIIPSGVCTAIIIPTTTLMYTLPISVMVAMVIMRASVIIISRIVDAIQIKQGILNKKVYWEENVAVLLAICAVSTNFVNIKPGSFDFLSNNIAMTTLIIYIFAYGIRIYIMNYFKNTRPKNIPQDNKGFFAVEQIAASSTLVIGGFLLYKLVPLGESAEFFTQYHMALQPGSIPPLWYAAIFAGMAYGVGAFFSVFLFMFKGRTATFAGVVNRLTSLVAGTIATLLACAILKTRMPNTQEWSSLVFIFIAIYFLSRSEKRRSAELKKAHEIAASIAEEDKLEKQAEKVMEHEKEEAKKEADSK